MPRLTTLRCLRMADRTEKLTINRTLNGTNIKLAVVQNGITVNYSVKTYEHRVVEAINDAHAGVNKFFKQLDEGKEISRASI